MREGDHHTTPDEPSSDRPPQKMGAEVPPARATEFPTGHPDGPMPEGEETPPPGVRAMSIVRWGLVFLMGLAAFAAANYRYRWIGGCSSGRESGTVYYCPMHPGVQKDHPGDCPICSMSLVPKPKAGDGKGKVAAQAQAQAQAQAEAQAQAQTQARTQAQAQAAGGDADGPHPSAEGSGEYDCPMHPEVTSTDPNATCDRCGMKLEPTPSGQVTPPKDAQGVPGLVPVRLSPERIQLMGLRTARVTRETLAPKLRTVGTVVANEKGLAVIQTRVPGWIEELKVEETGQKVEKGQLLATLYSPELLTAQQEYLNARKWAQKPNEGQVSDLSAGLEKDARQRLELWGISTKEIEEIQRTGEPMHAVALRSPVSGYVMEKVAVRGLYVQPGTALFQIADLSTVWVLAEVYEYEMGRVKVGQPAWIEFSAYPGEKFQGKLTFVYPSLNPDTRTLRVRLEFKNPDLRLKPGMYGHVYIELERAEALVVPEQAIVDTGVFQYVFVALPGGMFEPRQVTVGTRDRGKVQVLRGVAEGETVVTTANFLLDSESRLQAAILGEGGRGHAVPRPTGDACETEFDKQKYPDKYAQCVACRVHRGMGTMEEECRKQIPKPWK